jgi:hypothetical protein
VQPHPDAVNPRVRIMGADRLAVVLQCLHNWGLRRQQARATDLEGLCNTPQRNFTHVDTFCRMCVVNTVAVYPGGIACVCSCVAFSVVSVLVSSSIDGDLGLRSKSYLADFWNRLSHAERWKLIGGAMSSSGERSISGKSSGKKDRTSSAASVASSLASILTSSQSGSKPTHDGDDVVTLGSDGGLTPYNVKVPSSTLSVGAVSAGNTSFSMRQHRRYVAVITCIALKASVVA